MFPEATAQDGLHARPSAQRRIEDRPAGGGVAATVHATPWGQWSATSWPERTRRDRTEIRLFNAEKKIEFVNHVQKDPVNDKEAIYFAFPLPRTDPQFEYEGQRATVNPARDALAGANREWFTWAIGRA